MKTIISHESGQLRAFIALLLLLVTLTGFTSKSYAQGWNFTATLSYSGPCGAGAPTIPPFTIPYMPTQSYCESVRQTILNIQASAPAYDSYGNYIGLCTVYYACSACTGSDVASSSPSSAPGSVSIDGLTQGTAFFSPHESSSIENWMSDYMTKLKSMGMSIENSNSFTSQNIPLTGDAVFDKGYVDRIIGFEKPTQGGVVDLSGKTGVVDMNSAAGTKGTTVQLLTTSQEQLERDQWMQDHGFNDLTQSGADNTIDASGTLASQRSWSEAGLRTAITEAPGLTGVIGDFMINTVDGTIDGIGGVVSDFTSGNDARALENAERLPGTILINAGEKTLINVAVDKATDFAGGPVLKLVSGAESVYKVAKTSLSIWENKKGE